MRPLRLAGVSVASAGTDDVLHAWSRLNEWIIRKSLGREVEIGYGLVGVGGSGPAYTACIELPDCVSSVEADELARASLEGGAYIRIRFQGPVSDVGQKLEDMRGQLNLAEHTRLDAGRPLVSVFLDVRMVKTGCDVRSNLLVPVCGNEVSKSPRKAA
ncbi:MAG: GyrI-like domain-containing protein [Alphaproteobacteria bacterium]|nr:GyrI-like domain-containing protein [Alphaproteobacteria bacterium]